MGQRLHRASRILPVTACNILMLPPEILIRIFLFLDVRSKCRVARVCREWSDIADIRSVWKDVEVSRLSPSSMCLAYVQRGIRRIRSPANPFDIVEWRQQLVGFLSHRRELSITPTEVEISLDLMDVDNSITNESLIGLLTCSSDSLHSLLLQQCRHITIECIDVIGAKCPNLTTFGLKDCFGNSAFLDRGHFFWNALSKMTRLRRLELQRIGGINDEFFRCLVVDRSTGVVPTAAAAAPLLSLRCLTVDQLITNASLEYISRANWPNLTELDLCMCSRITYDAMRYLSSIKQLHRLKLPCLRPFILQYELCAKDENGNYYSDIGMNTLATSGVLNRLHSLTVSEISDRSMELIAQCTTPR